MIKKDSIVLLFQRTAYVD